jgi:hypothetical protein
LPIRSFELTKAHKPGKNNHNGLDGWLG